MSDDYTRRYFSDGAGRWLERAYGAGAPLPTSYPVGARRVRVALELVAERLGGTRGRVLDVGCGGGDLCFEAAQLGFEATGVDIAEGMIVEAERRRADVPPDVRARTRFVVGDVLDLAAPRDTVDAVTALGLLEYLESDAAFFTRAATWLRPGGVLVVSCRNRLFNLASLNEYTTREVESGAAPTLLREVSALPAGEQWRDAVADLVARLHQALPELEQALDEDAKALLAAPPAATFAAPRRQHTPNELTAAAAAAGFGDARVVGVHPHPLPPAYERLSPRAYNRLATCFEAFERSPASLAWSSAFVAVFTRSAC